MQKRLSSYKRKIEFIEKKVQKLSQLRLLFGLGLFVLLMTFSFTLSTFIGATLVATLVFFIFLIKKTSQMNQFKKTLTFMSSLYHRHQILLSGQAYQKVQYDLPKSLATPQNLSLDKDLNIISGNQNLMSFIEHTLTQTATAKLITCLFTPLKKEDLLKKQNRIQFWLPLAPRLIKFLSQTKALSHKKIQQIDIQTLENPLYTKDFFRFFFLHIFLYTAFWFTLFSSSYFFPDLNLSIPVLFFIITSYFFRGPFAHAFQKAQNILAEVNFLEKALTSYTRLIPLEQQNDFPNLSLPLLKELKKIHLFTSFLSLSTNPIAHIATNFILPWEPITLYFLEKWRHKNKDHFQKALYDFDNFQIHLSSVLFTHFHSQTFPKIEDLPNEIQFEAYHPFLPPQKRKVNSYQLTHNNCGLITGSNMSGKSTFLRTVGLNHHLAQIGLPVFCHKMTTFISPLETCLRVSDSLEEGVSSFYYEIKRIKQMVLKAKNEEPFFYLIDEIFRGTNNKERRLGSESIIKTLCQTSKAKGLISTHDLELAELSQKDLLLENIHFSDSWDEKTGLTFDYKLKQGPSTTTNALHIMRLNGLPVPKN